MVLTLQRLADLCVYIAIWKQHHCWQTAKAVGTSIQNQVVFIAPPVPLEGDRHCHRAWAGLSHISSSMPDTARILCVVSRLLPSLADVANELVVPYLCGNRSNGSIPETSPCMHAMPLRLGPTGFCASTFPLSANRNLR